MDERNGDVCFVTVDSATTTGANSKERRGDHPNSCAVEMT
jgi:hypothetical protein